MPIEATVKMTTQNWWEDTPTISEHKVTGDDREELFAALFKEYFNRFKYCNSGRLEIKDSTIREAYFAWISDVNNYANAGGDMI